MWKKYKKPYFLVPLKWELFGIVCQERAEPVRKVSGYQIKLMKLIMPELNFKNCDLRNVENWGFYRNNYVLVDYGVTKEIAEMY